MSLSFVYLLKAVDATRDLFRSAPRRGERLLPTIFSGAIILALLVYKFLDLIFGRKLPSFDTLLLLLCDFWKLRSKPGFDIGEFSLESLIYFSWIKFSRRALFLPFWWLRMCSLSLSCWLALLSSPSLKSRWNLSLYFVFLIASFFFMSAKSESKYM